MYCKNCGQKISSTSTFCEFCGTEQEKTNQKRPLNIKKLWPFAAVGIALMVVIILVVALTTGPKSLDLHDYVQISMENTYDGHAYVYATLNCDKLLEEITEKEHKEFSEYCYEQLVGSLDSYEGQLIAFDKALSLELNEENGSLKNGDVVSFTLRNELGEEDEVFFQILQNLTGIKFKDRTIRITIDGLEEITEVDLQDYVKVIYKGLSGYAEASVKRTISEPVVLHSSKATMTLLFEYDSVLTLTVSSKEETQTETISFFAVEEHLETYNGTLYNASNVSVGDTVICRTKDLWFFNESLLRYGFSLKLTDSVSKKEYTVMAEDLGNRIDGPEAITEADKQAFREIVEQECWSELGYDGYTDFTEHKLFFMKNKGESSWGNPESDDYICVFSSRYEEETRYGYAIIETVYREKDGDVNYSGNVEYCVRWIFDIYETYEELYEKKLYDILENDNYVTTELK